MDLLWPVLGTVPSFQRDMEKKERPEGDEKGQTPVLGTQAGTESGWVNQGDSKVQQLQPQGCYREDGVQFSVVLNNSARGSGQTSLLRWFTLDTSGSPLHCIAGGASPP